MNYYYVHNIFLLVIDFIMRKTMTNEFYGIKWKNRRLTDLDFADDIAMIGETAQSLQKMTASLAENAGKVGLRISSEKTKSMAVGCDEQQKLHLNNQPIDQVNNFTYLSSNISSSGYIYHDINNRLGKASSAFQKLNNIWQSNKIETNIKVSLYNSLILSVALYACETWKITKKIAHKLDTFHQRCLRKILQVTWKHKIKNTEILEKTRQRNLSDIICERRLKLLGHVLRFRDTRHAKTSLYWMPENGRRKRGRPAHTWKKTVENDLKKLNSQVASRVYLLLPDIVFFSMVSGVF